MKFRFFVLSMLLMSMCQSVFAEKDKSAKNPTCQIRINHEKPYKFILHVDEETEKFSHLSAAVAARDKHKCQVKTPDTICTIVKKDGYHRIYEVTKEEMRKCDSDKRANNKKKTCKMTPTPWVFSSLDKGSPDAQSTLDWLVSNGVCAKAKEVKKSPAPSVDASAGALGAS